MRKPFLDSLDHLKEDIIRESLDLISIPSITHDVVANQQCLAYLENLALASGLTVRYTPEKDCLVISLGEGSESVGILAHVDVVAIGDPDKWETPPFEGQFDGQTLIGRGAMDDKVPVVIIFNLIKALSQLNHPFKRSIQFIIGTKEEEEWTDMANYLAHFTPPDVSFTPDGGFPIHNIEKGYGDVVLSWPLPSCFSGGKLLSIHSGDSPNTIPSKGLASFELKESSQPITLASSGQSSHSSLPKNGENALTQLSLKILEQAIDYPQLNRIMTFISQMHGDYTGAFLGFKNEVLHYNEEYIGKTYANPTCLSYENDTLSLTINIRHKWGTTKEDILTLFQSHSETYGFKYHLGNYLDPLYVSREHPLFQVMSDAYTEVTGLPGGFALAGGTSYAKALPNAVSWGPVFPGEKDTCHQENEKIHIDSVMKCLHIYGQFLFDACMA
jgi:succinyl-diaminopimelate desuccinylase